jgi:hypothetical protein
VTLHNQAAAYRVLPLQPDLHAILRLPTGIFYAQDQCMGAGSPRAEPPTVMAGPPWASQSIALRPRDVRSGRSPGPRSRTLLRPEKTSSSRSRLLRPEQAKRSSCTLDCRLPSAPSRPSPATPVPTPPRTGPTGTTGHAEGRNYPAPAAATSPGFRLHPGTPPNCNDVTRSRSAQRSLLRAGAMILCLPPF